MAQRHLPYEAGGHPAGHDPVPELAADPPSPRDVDEFPDVPPGNDPARAADPSPPDQPDHDAFAARLGLRSSDDSDGADDSGDGRLTAIAADARDRATSIARRGAGTSRSLLAQALTGVSRTSAALAERVRPDDQ